MDCEKAQSLLLDELYGELDEVTSAALRRHASGCARCAADLESLRGTRKAVALPLEEPPVDLEQRIMAAVKEAQKVVPIRSRLSHVVSRAGSWAMRPQTAMAALFLLMVGSTTFLLRGRYSNHAASAPMTVLEEGTPTPTASAAQGAPNEPPGAVALATTPAPAASVAIHLPPAASKEGEAERQDLVAQAVAPPPPAADAVDEKSKGRASTAGSLALGDDVYPRNAGPIGGAAAGGSGYGNGNRAYEARPQAQTIDPYTSQEMKRDRRESDEFTAAMSAYRVGNYSEAVRRFDAAAASGDPTATLWAARSVRASAGCGAAAARFEGASHRLAGTPNGHDAALEAGQCRAENGDTEAARASLVPLLSVPSHKARAEATLNSLGQIAAKKAAGGSAGGLAAPKPAARAPSKAAAAEAPAAAPAPTTKSADKANAY